MFHRPDNGIGILPAAGQALSYLINSSVEGVMLDLVMGSIAAVYVVQQSFIFFRKEVGDGNITDTVQQGTGINLFHIAQTRAYRNITGQAGGLIGCYQQATDLVGWVLMLKTVY